MYFNFSSIYTFIFPVPIEKCARIAHSISNSLGDGLLNEIKVGKNITVTCKASFHVEGEKSNVKAQHLKCLSSGVFSHRKQCGEY